MGEAGERVEGVLAVEPRETSGREDERRRFNGGLRRQLVSEFGDPVLFGAWRANTSPLSSSCLTTTGDPGTLVIAGGTAIETTEPLGINTMTFCSPPKD